MKQATINRRILMLAKSAKVPAEELKKMYRDILEEVKEIEPDLKPDQQFQMTWNKWKVEFKRKYPSEDIKTKGSWTEGFWIGDTYVKDRTAWIRGIAKKALKQNKIEAKLQGLINEAEEPLDTRDKVWQFGKQVPNPNRGHVLAKELYRIIYGMFKVQDSWRLGCMNLNGIWVKNAVLKYYLPMQFYAIPKGNKDGKEVFNISKSTKFKEIKSDWDVREIFLNNIELNKWELLDTLATEARSMKNPLFFFRGIVNGEPRDYEGRGTSFRLIENGDDPTDPTASLGCWLPTDLKLNWGSGSELIVNGRIYKGRGDFPRMNVYGYYKLLGFPRGMTQSIEEEKDEVKKSWIEL